MQLSLFNGSTEQAFKTLAAGWVQTKTDAQQHFQSVKTEIFKGEILRAAPKRRRTMKASEMALPVPGSMADGEHDGAGDVKEEEANEVQGST